MLTPIGGIGNCYGGLWVQEENGTYLWGIEGYEGSWEEIPKEVYDTLMKFESERMAPLATPEKRP